MTRADKESVHALLEYASKNKIARSEVVDIFSGRKPPPGDNPKFSCKLRAGKRGYRVVFTYTEQPFGWSRHISVSALDDGRSVALEDLNDILRRFLFRAQLKELADTNDGTVLAYWEKISESSSAFNVVEPTEEAAAEQMADQGAMKVAERVGNSAIVVHDPRTLQ